MSTKTIQREELLEKLESVQPGLSTREIIEQSSCFVFQDGHVMTYNDEIACSQVCDIGVTGAVRSAALLAILRKLQEDELEISQEANELKLVGKRRECGIACEAEVHLPINSVEKPTKWKDLPADFLEAVELCQHCASHDESQFVLTCIHITPEYVEACDNAQLTRVRFATGFKSSILIRRDSLKHIPTLGMSQFSETETWIHFRNSSGLVLSCRRFVEDFHDLSGLIAFKGEPLVIPKGLGDAADKASVFSSENAEDSQVLVELRPEKVRITGQGASGWYKEVRKLSYSGPSLSFMIAPALLIDITKKYNEATITDGRLKVEGPDKKWVYVSCLAPASKE